MGMFLNYHNIADNYTPNNLICSFPVGKSYTKLDPVQASKPYEEYNTKGELVGYFWHYGETLNLEFNIDGEITVEDDALIYYIVGQHPTSQTQGKVSQKAYNVTDKRSWICTYASEVDKEYGWTEDDEFTYSENSPKHVYIDASTYLADKSVEVALYNFRMECVCNKTFDGASKIIFEIDSELSNKLNKGIYYCSLTVFNDKIRLPIFNSHDCVLSVK